MPDKSTEFTFLEAILLFVVGVGVGIFFVAVSMGGG